MHQLTEDDIENIADSKAILERGKNYFKIGKVKSLSINGKHVRAKIKGNYGTYTIIISFDKSGEVGDYSCSCPYDGNGCKHIVAVLYALLPENAVNPVNTKNSGWQPSGRSKVINPTLDILCSAPTKKNKLKVHWNISFDDVKAKTDTTTLIHALELLEENTIQIHNQTSSYITALVEDGEEYEVFLGISGIFWHTRCECQKNNCAHAIAVLLTYLQNQNPLAIPGDYKTILREQYRQEQLKEFTNGLSSIVQEAPIPQKYALLFKSQKPSGIELVKALILKNGSLGQITKVTAQNVDTLNCSCSSQKRTVIYTLVSSLQREWTPHMCKKQFDHPLDFELLKQLRALYQTEPEAFIDVVFPKEPLPLEISFQEQGKNYALRLNILLEETKISIPKGETIILGKKEPWIFFNLGEKSYFAEVDTKNMELLRLLLKFAGLELPREHFKPFLEEHYLSLTDAGNVNLPEEFSVQEKIIPPRPRIYLRDHGNSFSIELRFLYDQKEVLLNHKHDPIYRNENNDIVRLSRDYEKEKAFYSLLLNSQVTVQDTIQDTIILPSIDPYLWLTDTAKQLIAEGFEIFGAQELIQTRIASEEPELRLEVSSGIDWFDLRLEAEIGDEKISTEALLAALKNQERFIKLSDGRRGVIPEKWLQRLSAVIGFLEYDQKEKVLKASPTHLAIIDSLLEISKTSRCDENFKNIRKKFAEFTCIKEACLPQGLQGTLRPYQKAGYDWLHFLQEFSFGGCLADEMGLGKTVQVLTLLLNEKGAGLSLVVVPTSLIFNWQQEVQKFTPDLKVYVHHGLDRSDKLSEIKAQKVDIFLTTYGTLKRDAALLKKIKFHYIILDESQNIKNPTTNIAQAVFSLQSKHRLILTGTPIENSSLDLWSQFAFLNPGLLGNMNYFKEAFAQKIERQKDEKRTEALKNLVHPFILMRKKEAVAKELPDKQITTLYCEMSEKQRLIYEVWKQKFREEIGAAIKEKGFMSSRMKILQGLTYLREICNHPRLVDESYNEDSGKFTLLLEQIKDVINEGHKVLVFSSFVKMLKLFQEEFDKEAIPYCYLDGSTTKRQQEVEEFQNNPDKKVFLISLKAGGLGLNLTAADYVYIVDPWWNPAAEMQAIDRSHRIGQKNKVFVYKAITKDSVEEKILELQESKLDLVKNVISVEQGIFKSLTKEDVDKMFG